MKLTQNIAKKYTTRYYTALQKFKHHQAGNEGTTETAFKDLLHNIALDLGLTLVKTTESISGKNNIIPDGIIKDDYFRIVGYWEAKDQEDILDDEIYKKLKKGYPRSNTIFEDTEKAVLYQDNQEFNRYNLTNEDSLVELLITFFNYKEPVYEQFREAVEKFKENISRLSEDFKVIIKKEKSDNNEFKKAVNDFLDVCKKSFHHDINPEDIEDMLIQHLLTERIFRKVFDNPDFTSKNVIAIQLEKLVTILTKRAFNKSKFFQAVDPYYLAIEQEAATFDDFNEKQGFLNKIYEAFFQSYSKKNADKNGIVYTPQSIVKFMVKFTENVLEKEFNKTLSSRGVNIIDPCTGTGNFVMEILKNIDKKDLPFKYKNEIFANELMLLPYYVASANIEHYFYETAKKYEPFENIVFTDTLELIENPKKKAAQQSLDFYFNEANSERAKRELNADLFVIIGNPPYNASQENENQNNKNTENEVVDGRISETYAKLSKAQLKNKLYDPYVKFIRWASDRLNKQNGIICFITNNSFISDIQFDGMRNLLLKDFHRIYHIDLGGDVYLNPKLSGTKHNVFGIKVGVGITFFVRNQKYTDNKIFYHRLDEFITREEKEVIISNYKQKVNDLTDIDWTEGYLDGSNNYSFDSSNIALAKEYESFIKLYTEEEKDQECIFKSKYPGINTARNEWVYDFSPEDLQTKMKVTIDFYNKEVTRFEDYLKEQQINDRNKVNIDAFVKIDESKIKWSAGLKQQLRRLKYSKFSKQFIELSSFRPFINKYYYNDKVFVDRPSNFNLLNETDNQYLLFSGLGSKRISAFTTSLSPNFDLLEKTQAFPLFNVLNIEETDKVKVESNLTDWAIDKFRTACNDKKITAEKVYHYIYGILHHQEYISRYDTLLKNSYPRIPLVKKHFSEISDLGKKLSKVHLDFSNAKEIPLKPTKETLKILSNKKKIDYSIERLKISKDKLLLTYNKDLEFFIPKTAWGYEVNGRTPLEWIVDQVKDFDPKSDSIIKLCNKSIGITNQSLHIIAEISKIKI